MKFKLPTSLEPFRKEFEKTALDCIRISKAEGEPKLWESKLGGHPYLPKNVTFPKNAEGKDLVFLAQINFEEAPHLDPFPTSGILQFFINDDDLYGLDFDNQLVQNNFRIIYYDDTILKQENNLITDFSFLRAYDFTPHMLNESYKFQFEIKKELVPVSDFQSGKEIGKSLSTVDDDTIDEYNDLHLSSGHKMGGYAHFTQEDPRSYDKSMQNLMLLLQLDTDPNMEIMWGDCGICNFFIDPKKLAKKDFSEVMYNWDCC